MNDDTTLEQAIIRLWLIRHGNTEDANQLARELGKKLSEQKPLNWVESSLLASALFESAENGEAERFFNNGHRVNKRNRHCKDFILYEKIKAHRATGKTLTDSVKLAGNELNYPDEFEDEWESTALFRYESVDRSFNKLRAEVGERTSMGPVLGGMGLLLKQWFSRR